MRVYGPVPATRGHSDTCGLLVDIFYSQMPKFRLVGALNSDFCKMSERKLSQETPLQRIDWKETFQEAAAVRAVLMGTKSCTKILILPKIFPTRFRFTFYG